jgi:threonine dehydrogenase-like Zn-dependent dehydrogenase
VKALRFHDGAPVIEERPEPTPAAGEARIRVSCAGICGTDLQIARGYMSFDGVPGHEFVGVVEEADSPEWIGRRVVGEINAACGSCAACAGGLPRHCPERSVLGILRRDGAFAEHLCLPLANLHPVPAGVPDDVAVFTEPLAAAYEILEQVAPRPGTRTLVLGDGRLGQLCAGVLAAAGSPPWVCGRHEAKLDRLRRAGLQVTSSIGKLDGGFDLVVEASGAPSGLSDALSMVRPRGTVVLKSTYHGAAPVSLAGLVIDEITLLGSRCGPFEPALRHLADDTSIVRDMISGSYPLTDAQRAFEHASRHDALKVLLTL